MCFMFRGLCLKYARTASTHDMKWNEWKYVISKSFPSSRTHGKKGGHKGRERENAQDEQENKAGRDLSKTDWQRPFDPHIKTPTVVSRYFTCNCNCTDMYMADMPVSESIWHAFVLHTNWICKGVKCYSPRVSFDLQVCNWNAYAKIHWGCHHSLQRKRAVDCVPTCMLHPLSGITTLQKNCP